MITVYIWGFRESVAWGHASLRVNGGTPPGEIYISWWPESDGQRTKVPGIPQIFTVNAIRGRKYEDDVAGEGQPPDHVINFSALDETAIKKWWTQLLQGAHPQWSPLIQNCSTIVAHALAAGAGDDMVTGFEGWLNSWNTVWKPEDVLNYTWAIQRGITRLGIWHCGARGCPTHRGRNHRCASGVWVCGRRVSPCPGHSSPEHRCTTGIAWHCGARDCRTHKDLKDRCASGVWSCGRRIPACPGHSSLEHRC
jgi:hypothetical protein